MALLSVFAAAVAISVSPCNYTTTARTNHLLFVNNVSIVISCRFTWLLILFHNAKVSSYALRKGHYNWVNAWHLGNGFYFRLPLLLLLLRSLSAIRPVIPISFLETFRRVCSNEFKHQVLCSDRQSEVNCDVPRELRVDSVGLDPLPVLHVILHFS